MDGNIWEDGWGKVIYFNEEALNSRVENHLLLRYTLVWVEQPALKGTNM